MQVLTNYKGCTTEYHFATECSRRNYIVSMPLLDSSPYDAIVDTHQRIYKVQIKYTAGVPDERKNSVHIALEGKTNRYNLNNVDFFAVYSEHYQGFFIFPNTGSMKGFRLSLNGKNSIYFNNFAFGS